MKRNEFIITFIVILFVSYFTIIFFISKNKREYLSTTTTTTDMSLSDYINSIKEITDIINITSTTSTTSSVTNSNPIIISSNTTYNSYEVDYNNKTPFTTEEDIVGYYYDPDNGFESIIKDNKLYLFDPSNNIAYFGTYTYKLNDTNIDVIVNKKCDIINLTCQNDIDVFSIDAYQEKFFYHNNLGYVFNFSRTNNLLPTYEKIVKNYPDLAIN